MQVTQGPEARGRVYHTGSISKIHDTELSLPDRSRKRSGDTRQCEPQAVGGEERVACLPRCRQGQVTQGLKETEAAGDRPQKHPSQHPQELDMILYMRALPSPVR